MSNSLLSFGARNVEPDILEQTLTIRADVVDEIEKKCTEKAIRNTTFQSLVIAPRGSGKTHITKVLYHRFKTNKELDDKIVLAYMSEDEVGISNFTDLLVNMLRAIVRNNEPNSSSINNEITEASIINDVQKRETFLKNIILKYANKKVIILLIENFDKILISLGHNGQGSLRDFIHQYNNLSIIATSQNLISSLQNSKMPFYNFFNVIQLHKLDFNEMLEFFKSIAKMQNDDALLEDLNAPSSKGKLKAIYELTEGNHRLLVTFYSFLKADFKAELSTSFIKVMNDLKPYYEQFVNILPPNQQKIVRYLSFNRKAIKGKEIARACFMDANTNSKQLSLLFERGMIDKNKVGKDVYYELKEPLMRICFEIGDNSSGIAALFVDFLSAYYNKSVLIEKHLQYKYGAKFQSDSMMSKYKTEAQMYDLALNDIDREMLSVSHSFYDNITNTEELQQKIQEIENITQLQTGKRDFKTLKNRDLSAYHNYNNELHDEGSAKKYSRDIVGDDVENGDVYFYLGLMYVRDGMFNSAIASYEKLLSISPDFIEGSRNLAELYMSVKRYDNAFRLWELILENDKKNSFDYNNLAFAYLLNDDIDKSIEVINKGLKIEPDNVYLKYGLLAAYIRLNDIRESKKILKTIIERTDNDLMLIVFQDDILFNLFQYGSEAFIKQYFNYFMKLAINASSLETFWSALSASIFDILIHIEDYEHERLSNIVKVFEVSLATYPKGIIPLKMLTNGIEIIKNNSKTAIYNFTKEERKLFVESVIEKRERDS